MNCLHCEEELDPLDQDLVPLNDSTAFMHRECLLRGVIGSEDCIRRGPHAQGGCQGDDLTLTKRQAALAAYRAWLERNQPERRHVDAPAVAPALPLDDSTCYGTLGPGLMLELVRQCTRVPVGYLEGEPEVWLTLVFFYEFNRLRRRNRLN